MAVNVTYASTVTVEETLATNIPAAAAANRKVTHTLFNTSASLTSATTVPVTQVAAFEQSLTDGAATIDLTSLTGTNGSTVAMTGLKVQILKLKAKSTNANVITASEGASNGYELAGDGWKVALAAGQEVTIYGNDAAPDVASGAKTIDLAGTGTQTLEVMIVAG